MHFSFYSKFLSYVLFIFFFNIFWQNYNSWTRPFMFPFIINFRNCGSSVKFCSRIELFLNISASSIEILFNISSSFLSFGFFLEVQKCFFFSFHDFFLLPGPKSSLLWRCSSADLSRWTSIFLGRLSFLKTNCSLIVKVSKLFFGQEAQLWLWEPRIVIIRWGGQRGARKTEASSLFQKTESEVSEEWTPPLGDCSGRIPLPMPKKISHHPAKQGSETE